MQIFQGLQDLDAYIIVMVDVLSLTSRILSRARRLQAAFATIVQVALAPPQRSAGKTECMQRLSKSLVLWSSKRHFLRFP